jgi:CheY-like chemotaxis protein
MILRFEPCCRRYSLRLVYQFGSTEDGFSALAEIRKEIPDILLSDLNMPDMSGFELLSVVHRRFPSIPVIAMRGAFSGDEVPSGVAADAFYQKGFWCPVLVENHRMAHPAEAVACQPANQRGPLWIQRNGNDASGKPYVSIPCPDCLRTSSRLSVVLSARDAKRIVSIAGIPFTTQSSTGRLDRRLIDVIVRQSQPAPLVLLRNKKAVPMRNITRAPASRPSVRPHQRECPRVELQAALRPPSSRCHPRPSRHPVTFVQRQFSTTEWPVPSIQRVC